MFSSVTVAFDADDTLWHNEGAFAEVEGLFGSLMDPWASPDRAMEVLVDHERERVGRFGYGVKSFALAMIAAACDLSDGQVGADTISRILAAADDLVAAPTVLIDGALEALRTVSARHPTLVITKGDAHHQMRRMDTTEVAEYCFDIEVVAEKDAETYRRVLARHRIDPAAFVMIGNSVPSDVAPVLDLGGSAIHIPYEVTWALEEAERDPEPGDRWVRAESIAEVPALVETLADRILAR